MQLQTAAGQQLQSGLCSAFTRAVLQNEAVPLVTVTALSGQDPPQSLLPLPQQQVNMFAPCALPVAQTVTVLPL